MFNDLAFGSWSQVVVGGIGFAMLFELPLILADFLTEGSVGMAGSTLAFGVGAFLGYVVVGGAILRSERSSDSV